MTSVPFWHDFCTLESLWHDFCTLGVGVPKLPPCCPGAGACPPSKIRSGTWFLRTEPLVGKWGAPRSAVDVAARPQIVSTRF